MAITEIYVDPSLAADTGAGTVGDPYGDLEYAIVQTTFDTTNGTRVNVQAGTAEIMVSTMTAAMADTSVSAAWLQTATAPCVLQGYTTAAGDGGKCEINLNDNTMTTGADAYMIFIDMHIHNSSTSADVFSLGSNCVFIGCELNNMVGIGIDVTSYATIMNCYFHDIGAGRMARGGMNISNCVFDSTTTAKVPACCITQGSSSAAHTYRNLIICNSTTDGIVMANRGSVSHNAIWSDGGSGVGIQLVGSNIQISGVTNNLVEGFSASGGIAVDLTGTSNLSLAAYGGNSVYDCETAFNDPEYIWKNLGGNETLSASPFTDAANGDFSPVDTGSVKEGALPQDFGNSQY